LIEDWVVMGSGMIGGFGGMGLMSIVLIVILGLIIWGVVAAVRHPAESSSSPDSGMNVLQRRYARGEINRKEYEEKKKDLA
jgi:putative membrane protein